MKDEHVQLFSTLQRLLDTPATNLRDALTHCANIISEALDADKVDAFVYDPARDSLAAAGTSAQPLSALQRRLGLDVMPLSNGGRAVEVYCTGKAFRTGDLLNDSDELRGIREGMKVQSELGLPLEVAGQRRGVMMIASLDRDHFTAGDEAFVRSTLHWIGSVAHRAELIEELERKAVEQGRRASAEELVTILAHDLRNFLSPVTSHLYALRQRAEADGLTHYLPSISAALNGLSSTNRLITDLLDVARIDRGLLWLDRELVDLASLARKTAEGLSTAEHQIAVDAEDAVVAVGDPRRIHQCLHNILTNAIEHSPRDSPVEVAVYRTHEADATWAQIEVRDQGAGIPEELRPHIFERFKTARKQAGGLGLGLYLAKQIALSHGGDLTVTHDAGTRFEIRLPGLSGPQAS